MDLFRETKRNEQMHIIGEMIDEVFWRLNADRLAHISKKYRDKLIRLQESTKRREAAALLSFKHECALQRQINKFIFDLPKTRKRKFTRKAIDM